MDKNVRVDHRIWNSLIAGGVFNYFFGYGFIFIYNLGVCKSESTLSGQEMDEKRKKIGLFKFGLNFKTNALLSYKFDK